MSSERKVLYSIGELSTVTGIGRRTLERWRKLGYLRPYTFAGVTGAHPRYRMEDFDTAARLVREAVGTRRGDDEAPPQWGKSFSRWSKRYTN